MAVAIIAAVAIAMFLLPDWLDTVQRTLIWSVALYGVALFLYPRQRDVHALEDDLDAHDYMLITPEPEVAQPATNSVAHSAAPQAIAQPRSTALPAGGSRFYQIEGQILEAILQEIYGIQCEVDSKQVFAPTFVGYILHAKGKVALSQLEAIAGDVAREINARSRRHQYGDVQVRVSDSQPLVLQVTRARLEDLNWSERDVRWKARSLATVLGIAWHGTKVMPVEIDLANENLMTGGFFGSQGSGKSTLALAALVNLLQRTPPEKLWVYGIDTKANVFSKFAGAPHMRQYTSDLREALEILRQFYRWCLEAERPNDGTYRLLIVDEFQDLLLDPDIGEEAGKLILDIMRKGRAGLLNSHAKIRCWFVMQDPNRDNFPSEMKRLTHFMVTGHTLYDKYLNDQLGIAGAAVIKPQKEAIIISSNHPNMRFSSFNMPDSILDTEIQQLKEFWGEEYYDTPPSDTEKEEPIMQHAERASVVAPSAITATVQRLMQTGQLPNDGSASSAVVSIVNIRGLTSRALKPEERAAVRKLAQRPDMQYGGKPSMRKLAAHVYAGARSTAKEAWVKEAIEEKV